MNKLKVIIQGDEGSNHHLVSLKLFPDYELELICAKSFPELFHLLAENKGDLAVMAIENSIAGSLLNNYDLLTKYKFPIIGEAYLRIEHCLIGLEGATIDDIKIAYSHEMALKQCTEFFETHNIEAREYYDTAASVPYVKKLNDKSIAGVAPGIAAEIYGLEVIKKGIETNKDNYTRFVVLKNKEIAIDIPGNAQYKTMLELKLEHKPGSLLRILNVFAKANYNLTKIESRPVLGESWHYIFYLDFLTDNSPTEIENKLKELEDATEYYRILGIFKSGEIFHP